MMGDSRPEKSTKHFFLEIRHYRSTVPLKAPEPLLVAAYGVKELLPTARARAALLAGKVLQEQTRPHHGGPFPKRRTSRVGDC